MTYQTQPMTQTQNFENVDIPAQGALATANPEDKYSMENIIFDERLYHAVERMSKVMANGSCTVPAHLKGKESDCFAIICQAMRWGFDPYAVAQKTFVVNGSGILSYESQLIISVINARAPLVDRLNYEWFGPWENVVGKFVTKTSQKGNSYHAAGWSPDDEKGCGVRVFATMRGEEEPRVLELLLSQAQVRNSTLWASDPKQQLAYLAAKRWARLHAPETVLGLYSQDELEDRETLRDVTPTTAEAPSKPVKGSEALKQKLSARKVGAKQTKGTVIDAEPLETEVVAEAQNPIGGMLVNLEQAKSLNDLSYLAGQIKALGLEKGSDDYNNLLAVYNAKKAYFEALAQIDVVSLENITQVREFLNSKQPVMNIQEFADLQDLLNERENILYGGQ